MSPDEEEVSKLLKSLDKKVSEKRTKFSVSHSFDQKGKDVIRLWQSTVRVALGHLISWREEDEAKRN